MTWDKPKFTSNLNKNIKFTAVWADIQGSVVDTDNLLLSTVAGLHTEKGHELK